MPLQTQPPRGMSCDKLRTCRAASSLPSKAWTAPARRLNSAASPSRSPPRDTAVVTLRQPGGTALGDRIRSVVLDSRSPNPPLAASPPAPSSPSCSPTAPSPSQRSSSPRSPPDPSSSAIVITDSSEAYQGGGRQLGSERILALHAAVCDNLQPDLTILLLPPLEPSLAARPQPQPSPRRTRKSAPETA